MGDIIDRLDSCFDVRNLFKLGPYNRYRESYRVELRCESFNLDIQDVVSQFLSLGFGANLLICFLIEERELGAEQSYIDEVSNCGIKLRELVDRFSYLDEDDECYRTILIYQINKSQIEDVIRGKLARHWGEEPYFMAELFVIDEVQPLVFNLYDDRGFDIVDMRRE